jgi:hypothetical protein
MVLPFIYMKNKINIHEFYDDYEIIKNFLFRLKY